MKICNTFLSKIPVFLDLVVGARREADYLSRRGGGVSGDISGVKEEKSMSSIGGTRSCLFGKVRGIQGPA